MKITATPSLAAHARQHGPSAGHPSLGKLAQRTVCKILAEHEIKPHVTGQLATDPDDDSLPLPEDIEAIESIAREHRRSPRAIELRLGRLGLLPRS